MKTKLLIYLCILTGVSFAVDAVYACPYQDPKADFQVSPAKFDSTNNTYYVCIGQEITFDGSEPDHSLDPDSELHSCAYIESWEWDFYDNGTVDYTEDVITHTFETAEQVDVKLTVTDNDSDCCTEYGKTCYDKSDSITYKVKVLEVASLLPDEGTEMDDGDGDPDTKWFVVCKAATGEVTVTATPNPSISSESDLPDCWTLEGGTGTSKLSRTVDKTKPDEVTITCTAGSSSKKTTIYVISDLTVIPRKAYVCAGDTKEFEAWKCVDGVATDVTDSAEFDSDTGYFGTGEDNNKLYAGISPGDYPVTASYDGEGPTDEDHDCDLTVVAVEKIVEEGTTDEGPLYRCKGEDEEVNLEAKPDLAGSSWPPGKPTWTVSGPPESSPTLDPELDSDKTTLSGLSEAGEYTVIANCCSASLDWITVNVLEIRSETISTEPSDRSRTLLGLGEEVQCSVYPSVTVKWSVEGEGSVNKEEGTSIIFAASKSPSNSTVHAKIGTVDCTLDFEVIAPEGHEYQEDDGWTELYPRTYGPPDNYIGNGRCFPTTIQPTTVSFYNLQFRENLPGNNWTWPDGTPDSIPSEQVYFTVTSGNHGSDKVQASPEPYSRLHDGSSYVAFSYFVDVPLEYKNEYDVWVEFMSASENRHEVKYTSSGACSLKVIADNTQESDAEGPWQD